MKTEMPLSKLIRRLLHQTEEILDTEISLLRNPDAEPGGSLVDVYTYDIEKNVIIFPAQYIGLLKNFVIAKHCTHLLIKKGRQRKKQSTSSVPMTRILFTGGCGRSTTMP